jgi:hypothetical protein
VAATAVVVVAADVAATVVVAAAAVVAPAPAAAVATGSRGIGSPAPAHRAAGAGAVTKMWMHSAGSGGWPGPAAFQYRSQPHLSSHTNVKAAATSGGSRRIAPTADGHQ